MKIVFANPPFCRYKSESPKGDRRLILAQLMVMCSKVRGGYRLLKLLAEKADMRFGIRAGSRWPFTMNMPVYKSPHYPFLMGYSAALLRSKGFDTTIIDYIARNNVSYKQFIKEVKSEHADIVVMECSTPTVDIDVWMAEELAPFTKIALAGSHITANAESMQQKYPFVTYWLKGEYILSSLKMAEKGIPGIYESDVVTDLDAIPFPLRDYRGGHSYYDSTMPTAAPQLQIYASKGCPFHCSFCLWPQTMYKGIVAQRSPKKVIEEIKYNIDRFGYKSIFFDDDTFNVGNDRISNLCDELKKKNIPWTMMGRIDCSPDWLFDKMIDSGCVGMRLGVESFDIGVLKNIKKGIERIDFQKTLTYLVKKYPKLRMHLTMMQGLPGQTAEIRQRDMQILQDMGFHKNDMIRSYQLSHCAPFPGTEMFDDLAKLGHIKDLQDFSKYDGGQTTIAENLDNMG
ncbi:hypothetical protein FACS1894137_12470 [Spirochaetia bacterium]|nr:hypothetical protein FACS1894137_12470 [Spirochaetia bacterium]